MISLEKVDYCVYTERYFTIDGVQYMRPNIKKVGSLGVCRKYINDVLSTCYCQDEYISIADSMYIDTYEHIYYLF